jgi:HSP20 family protein
MKRRIYSGWELLRLQQQLEDVVAACTLAGQHVTAGWTPPVDILERDNCIVVLLDLPGVAASDLHVALCDRTLRIAGHKGGEPHEGPPRRYHKVERHMGQFELEIWLPGPVDRSGSTARLRGGVLEVAMPRIEERRNTACDIQVRDEEP